MAERRYTTEQLESAETIMKMLAAVPKEKRAEAYSPASPQVQRHGAHLYRWE